MYGITTFLTLFLLYILSKFVLSILGFKFSSLQYFSIVSLLISINGLIYFSLLGSIPFSPSNPVPLNIFKIIVSILSFLLCAIAILLDFVFSKT